MWNWCGRGTGASVAGVPEPGREVWQRYRSRCVAEVPNFHSSSKERHVDRTGHYSNFRRRLDSLINELGPNLSVPDAIVA